MPQGTEVDRLFVSLDLDMSGFNRSMKGFGRSLDKIGRTVSDVGKRITAALTIPIVGAGAAALRSAAKFEQMRNGLASVMGSSKAAQKEFQKLSKAAQMPGLSLEGALQGSVKLQAVGLSADEARAALTQFGNALAIAGGNAQDLDGVATALTQIISKGTISAEEINQLAERIPQIRAAMQQAFGTADTEALQKMGIEAEAFVNRVVQQFAELPRATGGLANAFTNLRMSVSQSLGRIGETINKTFNVTGLVTELTDGIRSLVDWFQGLSDRVKRLSLTIAGLTAVAGPVLVGIGALGTALAGLSAPVVGVVAGIGALIAGLVTFRDEILAVLPEIGAFFGGLLDSARPALRGLGNLLQRFVERTKQIWDAFGDTIIAVLEGAFEQIGTILQVGVRLFARTFGFLANLLTGNFADAWSDFKGFFRDLFVGLADIMLGWVDTILKALQTLVDGIPAIGDSIASGLLSARSALASIRPDFAAEGEEAGRSYAEGFAASLNRFFGGSSGEGAAAGGPAAKGVGAGGSGKSGSPVVTGRVQGAGPATVLPDQGPSFAEQVKKVTGTALVATNKLAAAIPKVQEGLTGLQQFGQQAFTQIADSIGQAFGRLVSFQTEVRSIGDVFKSVGRTIIRALQKVVSQLAAAIAKAAVFKVLMSVLGISTGGFTSVLNLGVGRVLGLAEGAIVKRPMLAMVGEGGQSEAVIPLDRMKQLGGVDEAAMARAFAKAMSVVEFRTRNGALTTGRKGADHYRNTIGLS